MNELAKSKGSGYGWVILIVALLAGITAPANMGKVTALGPVVMSQFGFNEAELGLVIALFYVMGFVMAFPTTGLINKVGFKGTVTIACVTGVIGCIMGALAIGNVPLFLISRVFEGVGFGIMGVCGSSCIAPWFKPEKRSIPLGFWASWVPITMCICPVLYGWIVAADGLNAPWVSVWWGTMVYDIVAWALFMIFYRKPPKELAPEETADKPKVSKAVFKRAYKSKMLWGLAIIFFLDEAVYMAINGFLTTYLDVQLGTGLIFATTMASIFGLIAAIAPPIGGAIAQRLNCHRWLLLIALICGVILTATVFVLKDPNLYYIEAIVAGIVAGWVPGMLWQFAPNSVENPDDVPAANSLLAFTQNIGMFIGAVFMGSAITAFGWTWGPYIAMLPFYIVALIIFFAFGLHKTMKLESRARAPQPVDLDEGAVSRL